MEIRIVERSLLQWVLRSEQAEQQGQTAEKKPTMHSMHVWKPNSSGKRPKLHKKQRRRADGFRRWRTPKSPFYSRSYNSVHGNIRKPHPVMNGASLTLTVLKPTHSEQSHTSRENALSLKRVRLIGTTETVRGHVEGAHLRKDKPCFQMLCGNASSLSTASTSG